MKIIYIDGHCNLCNGLIKYLYQRRPYLFSYGKTSLDNNLDYVIYSRDGEIFKAEKAVLMIWRDMGGVQKKISHILSLIPNIILRKFYFSKRFFVNVEGRINAGYINCQIKRGFVETYPVGLHGIFGIGYDFINND